MPPLHGTLSLKTCRAFFLVASVADALSVAPRADPEPSSGLASNVVTFNSEHSGDKVGHQMGGAASVLSLAAIGLVCCLLVVLACLLFSCCGDAREREAKPQCAASQEKRRLTLTAAAVPDKPRGPVCAADVDTLSSEFSRSAAPLPLAPLCPKLLVPKDSKLQCVVPGTVCRKRQNAVITISSLPQHGGGDLFRARLTEEDESGAMMGGQCGIHLEALHGVEQFSFIGTQKLWTQPPGPPPKLAITRPGGLKHATLERNEQGEYVIMCGLGKMVVFSGDYQGSNIQVRDGSGQLMAHVSPAGSDQYEVLVYPELDAGLIIHSLLAIDKVEKAPPRQPLAIMHSLLSTSESDAVEKANESGSS